MDRSLLRLRLVTLLAAALAGCRSVGPGECISTCSCGWEDQALDTPAAPDAAAASVPVPAAEIPTEDPSFAFALRVFTQPGGAPPGPPAGAAGWGSDRREDKPASARVSAGVALVPNEEPASAAIGPRLPVDPWPSRTPATALRQEPLGPEGEHRSLRGKLEPGFEPGTWSLRYQPEPETRRPGGAVLLVSSQPLCGCHEGWEALVEGYPTAYGRERAFQVERLVVIPPPVRRVQAASQRWEPPPPNAKRRSLVGMLEPAGSGVWNLLYYDDPGSRRPVGVVTLVAEQPLYGLREGREVRVEGYMTRVGLVPAFQVESLAMVPPR
jgi:hypothetical protein